MKTPNLPSLIGRKIYKTGQTRGFDDDSIYQNRVSRTSTVLIQIEFYDDLKNIEYENGYIVLVSPQTAFDNKSELETKGLKIGRDTLIFYETRDDWVKYSPKNLSVAQSRKPPLRGQYVARVPGTTGAEGKIMEGFSTTSNKGAGIQVFEYADAHSIELTRIQLEALFWRSKNSEKMCEINGMEKEDIKKRRKKNEELLEHNKLWNEELLQKSRIINEKDQTTCPLCKEHLDASGFFSRMKQAEGRAVHDITVTDLNLFHVQELRMGKFNHKPYNLGWGCHHCNIVTKDKGIEETLDWMCGVLKRNKIKIK